MDPQFRPIRKETVMCTVQSCLHVATFVFAGRDAAGRPVVAAYCDHHAAEAATQLDQPWPIPQRLPEDRVARSGFFRAG
jgi:hypothetical protein